MSQVDLARSLGIVERTVQGIELGEHRPSYTSRMRFAELKIRFDLARSTNGGVPE